MSMQRYPQNPIERRKQAVRRYSKNGVLGVSGGVIGGLALWALTEEFSLMVIGLVVAVVIGVYSWTKVRSIVNHKDNY
ncbi:MULTISPECIES: hypothetical protein [Corynebacterium]|uniref:Uncharacterized protein n=2 Tax=Corynebacterium glucuronolyticum TaxID=39791 RepID=A0A7T4EDM2_9CORY|nr:MULTISPECIES: hypothetical protein [Corynebacterium]EEI26765.1 hypothetical protein HMPREF0294_1709 [Corynebacterium glucuronolyticum ATCC 51867]EEI61944.1 hypothetical protein HMPREF0293_2482 [Corynebacterium glucuronolyticum ATCC 51866]MCT1562245.1 hypothetical protein [Corynebacterium glucuronolyticum]OFO43667.1 hypothetical protein HMPREF3044_02470 [Corynebacterium sp. HMSC073D01]QQB45446.1 hypothetical protein I6I10_07895 [Corynebacterium glucuronolyticum]